jgi:uncharacterized membrane protein YciS (DUF1049 family)
MNSNEKPIRRVAAAAIAVTGVIHLVLAPEQLSQKAYIGALFIAGGVAALVVAARLWIRSDGSAWTLGAVVSACMFVGFILSRTTGLPGFKEPDWELSGIVTLVLEAGFVAAFIAARRAQRAAVPARRSSQVRATPRRRPEPQANLQR